LSDDEIALYKGTALIAVALQNTLNSGVAKNIQLRAELRLFQQQARATVVVKIDFLFLFGFTFCVC
jgi:hypothetical protein